MMLEDEWRLLGFAACLIARWFAVSPSSLATWNDMPVPLSDYGLMC